MQMLLLLREASLRNTSLPFSPLIKRVYCDLEDFGSLRLPEGEVYDAFFHLAWQGTTGAAREDAVLQQKNSNATEDAAELAARLGCRVFVGAGSQAEYGNVPVGTGVSEQLSCRPCTAYGAAKLEAAERSRRVCKARGMRHVWARIFSVYGPFDGTASLVMTAVNALLSQADAPFTRGEQQWDYLFCADAARALIALAERGVDGEVYNVASGDTRPLSAYLGAIRDELAPEATLSLGALPYREGQPMNLAADIQKLCRDTGFAPSVPFAEGIRRTAAWYREMK